MNKIKLAILLILCIFYNLNSQIIINNSQNAPITTINSVIACPNTIITLNITIINVDTIAGVNFELDYDSAVLSYIEPNPNHIPGNYHNTNSSLFNAGGDFLIVQSDFSNLQGYKKIRPAWSIYLPQIIVGIIPYTINNVAILFEVSFKYYGGNTTISFNNSIGSIIGLACEWTDNNGNSYIDTPTEYFYHDGAISQCTNIGINNS